MDRNRLIVQFNHHFLLIGDFPFLPADSLGWPTFISTRSPISSKRSRGPCPRSEPHYLFLRSSDLSPDLDSLFFQLNSSRSDYLILFCTDSLLLDSQQPIMSTSPFHSLSVSVKMLPDAKQNKTPILSGVRSTGNYLRNA